MTLRTLDSVKEKECCTLYFFILWYIDFISETISYTIFALIIIRIFFTIILIFLIMFFPLYILLHNLISLMFVIYHLFFSTEFNRLNIFFIFSSYVEKIMAAMTKILTNSSTQIIPKLVPFKNEPSKVELVLHFYFRNLRYFLITKN